MNFTNPSFPSHPQVPTHAPWSRELQVPSHATFDLAEQIANRGFSFLVDHRRNLAESMPQSSTTFTELIPEEKIVLRYYNDANRAQFESAITGPLDYRLRSWSKGTLAVPRSLAVVPGMSGAVVILEEAPGLRYDQQYTEPTDRFDQVKRVVSLADSIIGKLERRVLFGGISSEATELYTDGTTTYFMGRPSKQTPSWLISRTTSSISRS